MVLNTDLCVGATVALFGINIVPEAGLYNGARGTLIDFIFERPEGPNNRDGDYLPECVIVDFPGLKLNGAEPWDKNNPTVSSPLGPYVTSARLNLIPTLPFPLSLPARTDPHARGHLFQAMLSSKILPPNSKLGNHGAQIPRIRGGPQHR